MCLIGRDAPGIAVVGGLPERGGIIAEQSHVAQVFAHGKPPVGGQGTIDLRPHGGIGLGAAAVEGVLAPDGGVRRGRHIIRRWLARGAQKDGAEKREGEFGKDGAFAGPSYSLGSNRHLMPSVVSLQTIWQDSRELGSTASAMSSMSISPSDGAGSFSNQPSFT